MATGGHGAPEDGANMPTQRQTSGEQNGDVEQHDQRRLS
jgi:hypothetical protein